MSFNFIKTTDVETAKKLRSQEFQEIVSSEPGVFVFLNCNKIQFSSDVDVTKIRYTNTLCI